VAGKRDINRVRNLGSEAMVSNRVLRAGRRIAKPPQINNLPHNTPSSEQARLFDNVLT
jgi:hypothetical protein